MDSFDEVEPASSSSSSLASPWKPNEVSVSDSEDDSISSDDDDEG